MVEMAGHKEMLKALSDNNSDDQSTFLYPLSVLQNICLGANRSGYYLNAYAYTLCSAAPLQDHHVRQALVHTFRMFPNLQLCLRKREGQIWTCKMDHEEIDFQVVDGEAREILEEVGTHLYNDYENEGPLWCGRLLKNESNVRSSREELHANFPHVRTLIIGNHHAIADGTSNAQFMEHFFRILDDVIAGRDVDDTKAVVEYRGYSEWQEVHDSYNTNLEINPEKLNALLKKYGDDNQELPVISRALTPPKGVPYKSRYVETHFDLDTSSSFIKKCKDNGVTVNSAIISLANVSLVDFFHESGLKQKEYIMRFENTVNMRRYLPKSMSKIVGPHISFFCQISSPTPRTKDSFWDYAKEVHKEFYENLEAGEPIIFLCIMERLLSSKYSEEFAKLHSPSYDYLSATMGNLDVHFKHEGDHVRLGHLVRFTTNAFEPLMFMYHSLRGRFYMSLVFSTNLVTEEDAQTILSLVDQNFKSLA